MSCVSVEVSARLEVVSKRFSDDLGDGDSFILGPANEALFELGVESDGLDG
jgi:hypothetical protein